jgi:hypothetical protein
MSAPKEIPPQKVSEAMLAITTGLVVIGLFLDREALVMAGAITGGIGLLLPPLARLITKGWFWLSEKMGWVMSRVILSAVFFLFLTPIALLRKVTSGSKALALKRTTGGHWVTRDHTYSPADLEKPW